MKISQIQCKKISMIFSNKLHFLYAKYIYFAVWVQYNNDKLL